ncbi:MAG: hypothetical protein ACXAC2_00220 [Candidatus Kariarchaeaceae archaeon]|jgi:hypothetical protein
MSNVQPKIIGQSVDPAADTEITLTLGENGPYKLSSLQVPLVTDAGVANRTVDITIEDENGNIFWKSGNTTAITASTTASIVVAPLPTEDSIGDTRFIPIPENLILPNGAVIKTITALRETGDNYGVMNAFGYDEGKWN